MKVAVAAAGALIVAAVGGWLALQGGASESSAVTATPPVGVAAASAVPTSLGPRKPFDYESATLDRRTNWLLANASPMAKMLDRALPKGEGQQPHMAVAATRVDASRRTIEVIIKVSGKYGIDRASVPAAKQALAGQVCPAYAKSPLGQNKVQVLHSFLDKNNREELSMVISPVTCRGFL